MNAAFTPGPWTVERNGSGHYGMVEVIGPRPTVRGFMIATDVSFEQGQQTLADARLIASAPNLYAALERISSETWADWTVPREIARAALASCDTHPKDGDVKQAPLVSGAVPEGQTPTHDPSNPQGRR